MVMNGIKEGTILCKLVDKLRATNDQYLYFSSLDVNTKIALTELCKILEEREPAMVENNNEVVLKDYPMFIDIPLSYFGWCSVDVYKIVLVSEPVEATSGCKVSIEGFGTYDCIMEREAVMDLIYNPVKSDGTVKSDGPPKGEVMNEIFEDDYPISKRVENVRVKKEVEVEVEAEHEFEYELDIIGNVLEHCNRHGLSYEDTKKLFTSLEEAAKEAKVEADGLFMILLDCISGEKVFSPEDVVKQIAIALDNNGIKGFHLTFGV